MSMNGKDLLNLHREKIADTLFGCVKRLYLTPEEALMAYMREQNNSLMEWLEEENRLLRAAAGEEVEPKAHKVQATLVGFTGGGSI